MYGGEWLQGNRSSELKEGAEALSQIKSELKIYVSHFVLDSRVLLVGIISATTLLLMSLFRRNSQGESYSWEPHSDGNMMRKGKKKVMLDVMVGFMSLCNLAPCRWIVKESVLEAHNTWIYDDFNLPGMLHQEPKTEVTKPNSEMLCHIQKTFTKT